MEMVRSKYKNVKTEYNGIKFHSKKEAGYASMLDMLKGAKNNDRVISYQMQVPYQVMLGGKKICKYLLDFLVEYHNRTEHVDVKGYRTAIYRLKKKLVEAQFEIIIKEV